MDATLAITTAETGEALEFLKELISDSLAKNEVLFRNASTAVIYLLEAAVRTGFYLCDARSFLSEGNFGKWLSENFELSVQRASQLRRLSTHFSRDLSDAQQRAKLNVHPVGLDVAIGPHV